LGVVVLTGPYLRVERANHQAAHLFETGDARGQLFEEMLRGDDAAGVLSACAEAFRTGEPRTTTFTTPREAARLRCDIVPTQDTLGNVDGLIVYVATLDAPE